MQLWSNNRNGTAGIIFTENSIGEQQIFFGCAEGDDQATDVQSIKDWGNEITLETAQLMVKHLSKDQSPTG